MNKKLSISSVYLLIIACTLIIFSVLIITFDIYKAKADFKNSSTELRENYYKNQKELLKNQVEFIAKIYDSEINSFETINKVLNIYKFGKNNTGYVFVLRLLNINGGKNFAIMAANPNRPDLIGKKLSDDYKDALGKEFRKEFLKGLREKGECFVEYWYKKPGEDKPAPKLSYFKLTKDRKYIIASGVYIDDVEKDIVLLENKLKTRINKNITFTVILILFTFLFLLLISKLFGKFLEKQFDKFEKLIEDAILNNKSIDKQQILFKECKLVATRINNIIEEKSKLIQKLEQSEKDFRTLFEENSVGMLISDGKKFIDCNQNAVKLLGYDSKESLLVNVGTLSPKFQPDGELSQKKAAEYINKIMKIKEPMSFQWVLCKKDGSQIWTYIHLSYIIYKNNSSVLVTWIDISKLKELESKLIKEKEQLAVTLYSIGDAVIVTELDQRITIMNKIAEQLTGWRLDEAKGRQLDEVFNIINEETGEKVENPINKVLKENKIVGLANHTLLISKNGEKYNIADSAAPIRDKNSNLTGVILVFRDETENIKMRNEITKMEKIKSISLLAGGIAHDFNNILTGIYGNLELIDISSPNDKTKEYINNTKKSLERATNLTKQLLTFSKGGDPIIGTVDIASVVKQVVEFNATGSNIQVLFNFEDNLWQVKADKGQISQVISNLVINAIHSMPDGGNLIVSMKNKLDTENNSKYVMISIQDEGIGMSEEILTKIFDPYFTTKDHGSGLGLSIVLSIINKHQGFIDVKSEEGKGTLFTILLPADDKASQNNKIKKDPKINLKNKRILLMDDDKEIREVVVNILESFGCIVKTARNGEEAIDLYKKHIFDVVITDLTVRGGMGGEQAVKKLLEIDPNAKVIISSGYFSGPIMSNYKEYGFVGIIHKPFNIQSLQEELSRILTT